MKDDTPDYSSYTLDDLHDVARRVNKKLYPDRYALILQELERRGPERIVEPFVLPRLSLSQGCLFPLLRFVGGFMAVLYAIDFLKLSWLEDWSIILGLTSGSFFAFFYDEKKRAPGEPVTLGYLVNRTLRMLLCICGGALLACAIAFILVVFFLPSDSEDLIAGMPNYQTIEYWMNGCALLGGVGALWLLRKN